MYNSYGWFGRLFETTGSWISYNWWIISIIFMVLMMAFCFFFMRRAMSRCSTGNSGCCFHFFSSKGRDGSSAESAKDILNRRFAAGEITKSEYDEMKNLIDKK